MVFTITNLSEEKVVEKGCAWKGIALSFIVSLPFLTHGLETTTLTSSVHSGHFINSDGVAWSTTALVLGAGLSAPVFCYIIDRYGRKVGIFSVDMVQGASLIPLFQQNSTSTILLHLLAGTSVGGLFTVIPIYIREITTAHSFCIAMMTALTSAGYMMKIWICLEVRMYVMVALVVMQFLSIIVMVESPSYLIKIKDFRSARSSVSQLKGLPPDSASVSNEMSSLKDESDRATACGKLTFRTLWRNKIWLDSIKIGIILYTIRSLCGSILFLDQSKTLARLQMTPDPESTLVLTSLLVGCFVCLILILFFDRKSILTLGLVIMTLATGVIGVYTQSELTVTSPKWIPIAALAVLVIGYGIMWCLPCMIITDILNLEIRATLLGAISAYFELIKLIHIHTFKYVEQYVGIYTAFYIFACINLFGVVYSLFEVPNIKDRSIQQIEKQLRRPPLPA